MLIGSGQLIKECRLAAVLVACQRKGQHPVIRKRMLIRLHMILSAFSKSGMIRIMACVRLHFGTALPRFLRCPAPHRCAVNLNMLCVIQAKRQFIVMNSEFNRIPHRSILYQRYGSSGNDAHVQKMLTKLTASPDNRHIRFLSNFQFIQSHSVFLPRSVFFSLRPSVSHVPPAA